MILAIETLRSSKIEVYEQFMGLAVVSVDGQDTAGLLFRGAERTYLLTAGKGSLGSAFHFVDITGKQLTHCEGSLIPYVETA